MVLDHRAGVVAAAVYNLCEVVVSLGGGETRGTQWRPADFFPSLAGPEQAGERDEVEDMLAVVVELNTLLGGRDLRAEA